MKGILVIEYDWADNAETSPIEESIRRLETVLDERQRVYVSINDHAERVLDLFSTCRIEPS